MSDQITNRNELTNTGDKFDESSYQSNLLSNRMLNFCSLRFMYTKILTYNLIPPSKSYKIINETSIGTMEV